MMVDEFGLSIDEALERSRRQCNFIFHEIDVGIYVDDYVDTRQLRDLIQRLVDEIVQPAHVDVRRVKPLRRNTWLRNVPVKVEMWHRDDAMLVINRKRSRPHILPGLRATKDLTWMQRRHYCRVYSELHRRHARGEKDFRIVHLHDYPVLLTCKSYHT